MHRHPKRLWQRALDILFPPLCLNCKQYLHSAGEVDALLCRSCFAKIEFLKPDNETVAVGLYENPPLRSLVHGLKYKSITQTMLSIEGLIALYLELNPELSEKLKAHDFIAYIPLHKKRLHSRGFNQAELIAKVLGDLINLPVRETLIRTQNTPQQAKTPNYIKRQENVKGVFAPREGSSISRKRILLVDDVYTSGATATEAMKTLKLAGAEKVTPFVLVKAG